MEMMDLILHVSRMRSNLSSSCGRGVMHLYASHLQVSHFRFANCDIKNTSTRTDRALLPFEILELVEIGLSSPRYQAECEPVFRDIVRNFVRTNVVQRLAAIRAEHGMFDAMDKPPDWDEETDLSMGASRA
jgi:hypothetical protein